MKALLDTSVLVAGLVPAHAKHAQCLPWLQRAARDAVDLVVAGHSLAEAHAVLTSLPLRPRIAPAGSWRLLDGVVKHATLVALDAREYVELVREAATDGLAGGVIHDAVISRVARKARVDRLLTLNVADFRRAWPEGARVISEP